MRIGRPAGLVATVALSALSTLAAAEPLPLRTGFAPPLPLTFERNTGRFPAQVEFVARSGGGTLFLTNREAVFALSGKGKAAALRLKLAGSNPGAVVTGLGKQAGIVNYLLGNDPAKWVTKVPTYSRVKLAGVYQGIDLVTYGAGKSSALQYDFVVKPGADPSRIRMIVSGARSLRTAAGKLIAATACGDVVMNRPYAYQTVNGRRKQVACSFRLERKTVAFQVARYDASRPLVVDPKVVFGTYLGGSGDEYATAMGLDAGGSAVICGVVAHASFPTTAGAYDTSLNSANGDAFVSKFTADGSGLVYSTFYGGNSLDYPRAMALDSAGAAVVCGTTWSTNLPVSPTAYDTAFGGANDCFVAKLGVDGSSLVYGTYLGGTGAEDAYAVAVDSSGAAMIGGYVVGAGFPTTAGAFDTSLNSSGDGFVTKLNAAGSALIFSTFLGGSGSDGVGSVALDAEGAPVVSGNTASANFPTTAGAYDTVLNGGADAFVAKLNATGTALVYSTFLGGAGADYGGAMALDATGGAVLTGLTASSDFPTTAGAYDTTANGDYDVFVARVAADGASLVYSTFLGGTGADYCNGMALDASGSAVVCGRTNSAVFPTTFGAIHYAYRGGTQDGFVAKLRADGSGVILSTLLGGAGEDSCAAVALDAAGDAVITGYTLSSDFPATAGAYDSVQNGGLDAFVAKVTFAASTTSLVATGATGQMGEMVEFTATLTSEGQPVPGATVKFTTPDSVTTSRTTNASGVANVWYDIPVGAATASVAVEFEAIDLLLATSTTATLTVNTVARVSALSATGRPGDPVTLYAYLWQGKTMAGLTGKQLTYSVDGGPAINFGSLTSGAYGRASSAYTIPGAMSVGDHAVTVAWAGGGGYAAAQGTSTLTVSGQARTYIWVHNHGATQNAATRLTCYLYDYRRNGDLIPVPGKSISFSVAGTPVNSAITDSSGKAFVLHTPASTGALAQSMSFAGDAVYAAGTGSGTLTVAP